MATTSTGSLARRAWKTLLPPAVMPNVAWPAPTMGTGFLPGPPSMIRWRMPSSAKKPLASATMTGANSPLRSQPSCVRTSTWATAAGGAAQPRASGARRSESAIGSRTRG